MKKSMLFILVLTLAGSLMFASSNKKKEEKLLTALQETDLQVRLQLLESFVSEFGNKEDNLSKLLYNNLVKTSFQLKQYDKTILYGDKALGLKSLDPQDGFALEIFRPIAIAAFQVKDMEKANLMAERIISLADLSVNPATRKAYIAPMLMLQALVLDARSEDDVATRKEALQKAIAALVNRCSRLTADSVSNAWWSRRHRCCQSC